MTLRANIKKFQNKKCRCLGYYRAHFGTVLSSSPLPHEVPDPSRLKNEETRAASGAATDNIS